MQMALEVRARTEPAMLIRLRSMLVWWYYNFRAPDIMLAWGLTPYALVSLGFPDEAFRDPYFVFMRPTPTAGDFVGAVALLTALPLWLPFTLKTPGWLVTILVRLRLSEPWRDPFSYLPAAQDVCATLGAFLLLYVGGASLLGSLYVGSPPTNSTMLIGIALCSLAWTFTRAWLRGRHDVLFEPE